MTGIGPTDPSRAGDGPAIPPEDAAKFLQILDKVSGRFADRRIGEALDTLEQARPMDATAHEIKQAAQELGGQLLRVGTSALVAPQAKAALSTGMLDLAEAGYNLPQIAQISSRIGQSLDALTTRPTDVGGGLATSGARQVADRLVTLSTRTNVDPTPSFDGPTAPSGGLTAPALAVVNQFNQAPWTERGERSPTGNALQGMAGHLVTLAASLSGQNPNVPALTIAMAKEGVSRLTAMLGDVATGRREPLDAAVPIVNEAQGVLDSMYFNAGGLGSHTTSFVNAVQGLANDAGRLFQAIKQEGRDTSA